MHFSPSSGRSRASFGASSEKMIVDSMKPGRRGFREPEEGAHVSHSPLFVLFLMFNRTPGDVTEHLAIEERGGNQYRGGVL